MGDKIENSYEKQYFQLLVSIFRAAKWCCNFCGMIQHAAEKPCREITALSDYIRDHRAFAASHASRMRFIEEFPAQYENIKAAYRHCAAAYRELVEADPDSEILKGLNEAFENMTFKGLSLDDKRDFDLALKAIEEWIILCYENCANHWKFASIRQPIRIEMLWFTDCFSDFVGIHRQRRTLADKKYRELGIPQEDIHAKYASYKSLRDDTLAYLKASSKKDEKGETKTPDTSKLLEKLNDYIDRYEVWKDLSEMTDSEYESRYGKLQNKE